MNPNYEVHVEILPTRLSPDLSKGSSGQNRFRINDVNILAVVWFYGEQERRSIWYKIIFDHSTKITIEWLLQLKPTRYGVKHWQRALIINISVLNQAFVLNTVNIVLRTILWSSMISLNISFLPSLLAMVKAVRLAEFLISILARLAWCFTAYPSIPCNVFQHL